MGAAVDGLPIGREVPVEVDATSVRPGAVGVAVRVDGRDDPHVEAVGDGGGVAQVLGDLDAGLLVAVDRADHQHRHAPCRADTGGDDRTALRAAADLPLFDDSRYGVRAQPGSHETIRTGTAKMPPAAKPMLRRSADAKSRVIQFTYSSGVTHGR